MKTKASRNNDNLRWFLSLTGVTILVVDIIVYKHSPSTFHLFLAILLLICGTADRFKFIKIPGFIELNEKVEDMNKRTIEINNKINQLQAQKQNQSSRVEVNVKPFPSPPVYPEGIDYKRTTNE